MKKILMFFVGIGMLAFLGGFGYGTSQKLSEGTLGLIAGVVAGSSLVVIAGLLVLVPVMWVLRRNNAAPNTGAVNGNGYPQPPQPQMFFLGTQPYQPQSLPLNGGELATAGPRKFNDPYHLVGGEEGGEE